MGKRQDRVLGYVASAFCRWVLGTGSHIPAGPRKLWATGPEDLAQVSYAVMAQGGCGGRLGLIIPPARGRWPQDGQAAQVKSEETKACSPGSLEMGMFSPSFSRTILNRELQAHYEETGEGTTARSHCGNSSRVEQRAPGTRRSVQPEGSGSDWGWG